MKIFVSYSIGADISSTILKYLRSAVTISLEEKDESWQLTHDADYRSGTLHRCCNDIAYERAPAINNATLRFLARDDAAWSGVELIKNMIPAVAGNEELHDRFVDGWAEAAASFPEPCVSPHLAWGLSDLFNRDRETRHLAIDMAHRMASTTSCDATRSVLGLLGDLQPRLCDQLPVIEARSCDPGNILRATTLLREAEAACRRVRSAEKLEDVFAELIQHELGHLREQTTRENTVSHFVALASLKFVFLAFCGAAKRRPPEEQRPLVERIVRWLYDPAQPQTSAFVATELLAPLWQAFAGALSPCVSSWIGDPRVVVRRSIIAAAVKYYLRRRSAPIPEPFDITEKGVAYRAPAKDSWLGFGQAAAETASRDATLIPYLYWANEQCGTLSSWRGTSPSSTGNSR